MRAHEELLAGSGYSLAHVDVVRRVLPELVALAELVAGSVADGLRVLTGGLGAVQPAPPGPAAACAPAGGWGRKGRGRRSFHGQCRRTRQLRRVEHARTRASCAGREDEARTAFQCARRVLLACAQMQQRLQSIENCDLQVGGGGLLAECLLAGARCPAGWSGCRESCRELQGWMHRTAV
jgi:hypothetical protein